MARLPPLKEARNYLYIYDSKNMNTKKRSHVGHSTSTEGVEVPLGFAHLQVRYKEEEVKIY